MTFSDFTIDVLDELTDGTMLIRRRQAGHDDAFAMIWRFGDHQVCDSPARSFPAGGRGVNFAGATERGMDYVASWQWKTERGARAALQRRKLRLEAFRAEQQAIHAACMATHDAVEEED